MGSFICIYCEKEYLMDEVSKSDIIPFAFIAGEKLILKNRVCKGCNNLVNKNAEQTIIMQLESLRRRINVTKRQGEPLKNQYVIKYKNDTIELETNPIKSDDPSLFLTKPIYFKDKDDKGVIIGPIEEVKDIASKKGEENKVTMQNITEENFTIYETYSVPRAAFFSKEMKTMVAKICYEWLIKMCPELNPLEDGYKHIRNSIFTDTVEGYNLVDVMTNTNIARGLFEDLSHLDKTDIIEFIPKKLVVGNYYLFFEIKNNKLYCFFAFMGMVLYRVLIASEGLINTKDNLLISLIYKYKGRTGEQEILSPNRETWAELSHHLSDQNNYNKAEDYSKYLSTKINELIKYRIEE